MTGVVKDALSKLVREGERVCNCGRAFETWHHPSESLSWDYNGTPRGRWLCMWGCSAAQIAATDRLAKAFLAGPYLTGPNDRKLDDVVDRDATIGIEFDK